MSAFVTALVIAMIFGLGFMWGRVMTPYRRWYLALHRENEALRRQLSDILRSDPTKENR